MKTSIKLILIYSGLIVAGTIAVYLSPFLFKDYYNDDPKQLNQYMEQVPDFSVVVIQEVTYCSVTLGDSSRIKWEQPSGKLRKAPHTTVRNDTLYVSSVTGPSIFINIMAKQVTSIVVKRYGYLDLIEPMQDKLTVQLDNAVCTLVKAKDSVKATQQYNTLHLTINAENKSSVQLFGLIDDLTATLDNSRLETFGSCFIHKVTLNLKNGSSSSFFTSSEQMNVQRDAGSIFQIK
jgi:hypothetical protein